MTVAFNIITPYLCPCFHILPSFPLSAYLKPTHVQSSAQMIAYMTRVITLCRTSFDIYPIAVLVTLQVFVFMSPILPGE